MSREDAMAEEQPNPESDDSFSPGKLAGGVVGTVLGVSAGTKVGLALGATVGAFFGGPFGAFVGSAAGGLVGQTLGGVIGYFAGKNDPSGTLMSGLNSAADAAEQPTDDR